MATPFTQATGKAVTVRDVARYAGVSHTTVSRVINDESIVTEKTRKRVKEAIEALNFAPNLAARMLSGGEHFRLALLHRFPTPGSLGEFLVYLLDHATKMHANVTVHEVRTREGREVAIDELVRQGVRGVILPPPLADDAELVERLSRLGMAIVATGSNRVSDVLPTVAIDDRNAAGAMTEHLISLGHRRIGFIKGDPRHASAHLRLSGFRAALRKAGMTVDRQLVADGAYTYRSGLEAAERLIGLDVPPTAIFASNDDMAAATVAVAHRRGVNVPEQLSVCGFDDSALATTIWPTLTTIRRPTLELTREATRLLLGQMSNRGEPGERQRPRLLDYTLICRESAGPPPSGT